MSDPLPKLKNKFHTACKAKECLEWIEHMYNVEGLCVLPCTWTNETIENGVVLKPAEAKRSFCAEAPGHSTEWLYQQGPLACYEYTKGVFDNTRTAGNYEVTGVGIMLLPSDGVVVLDIEDKYGYDKVCHVPAPCVGGLSDKTGRGYHDFYRGTDRMSPGKMSITGPDGGTCAEIYYENKARFMVGAGSVHKHRETGVVTNYFWHSRGEMPLFPEKLEQLFISATGGESNTRRDKKNQLVMLMEELGEQVLSTDVRTGKTHVVCPLVNEHTDGTQGSNTSTTILANGKGAKCMHGGHMRSGYHPMNNRGDFERALRFKHGDQKFIAAREKVSQESGPILQRLPQTRHAQPNETNAARIVDWEFGGRLKQSVRNPLEYELDGVRLVLSQITDDGEMIPDKKAVDDFIMQPLQAYLPTISYSKFQDAIDNRIPKYDIVARALSSFTEEPVPPSRIVRDLFRIPEADPMFSTYCEILRYWGRCLVGRGILGGTPCKMALVLHGAQDMGKTGFFRALCHAVSEDVYWGGFNMPESGRMTEAKHMFMTLNASWIAEITEIEKITRYGDKSDFKGFMDDTHLKYVPPYARKEASFPRRFVFGGSSNEATFLGDLTGNSRFFVIPVNGEEHQIMDFDGLKFALGSDLSGAKGFLRWLYEDWKTCNPKDPKTYTLPPEYFAKSSKNTAVFSSGEELWNELYELYEQYCDRYASVQDNTFMHNDVVNLFRFAKFAQEQSSTRWSKDMIRSVAAKNGAHIVRTNTIKTGIRFKKDTN